MIQAIAFDFGNTLFPLRPRELDRLLDALAEYLAAHVPPFEFAAMRAKYLEIRDRQFTENRATLAENDLRARIAETAAFVAGVEAVDPALVDEALEVYTEQFVRALEMPPWLPVLLTELSASYALGVLSNYPLALPIFRALDVHGLTPLFKTIVVSADIGFIKPHPSVFDALLAGLALPPEKVVYIGDDWEADIVGASRAGINAIYTRQWRDEEDKHYGSQNVRPMAEINDLRDLPHVLRAATRGA